MYGEILQVTSDEIHREELEFRRMVDQHMAEMLRKLAMTSRMVCIGPCNYSSVRYELSA